MIKATEKLKQSQNTNRFLEGKNNLHKQEMINVFLYCIKNIKIFPVLSSTNKSALCELSP